MFERVVQNLRQALQDKQYQKKQEEASIPWHAIPKFPFWKSRDQRTTVSVPFQFHHRSYRRRCRDAKRNAVTVNDNRN
jgi:hypothetical protein